MTTAELRAYAGEAARRAGIDVDRFLRQIGQESGWNPDAASPAGAVGIAQIVPRWHPGVDPTDPKASLDYAAGLMADYVRRFGSYRKALAAYNAGSGFVGGYMKNDGTVVPPWDGTAQSLPIETVHYLNTILGPGWPEPGGATVPVRFDPDFPASKQDDPWSCAPTSLDWAMRSLGRKPGVGWIESDFLALNIASKQLGLLDHTGQGIVNWLQISDAAHYGGEDGYGISNCQNPISWDELVPEINPHAPYPILLGLPRWDLNAASGGGHWVGVRGFDEVGQKILLANPASGELYGQMELTRQQFEARAAGNASIVRVLHPDLLGTPEPPAIEPPPIVIEPPAPPPPPPVVGPDNKLRTKAQIRAAIREVAASIQDIVDRMEP